MDVATDGEMRRIVFFEYFVSAIEGLSYTPAEPVHFHGDRPDEAGC